MARPIEKLSAVEVEAAARKRDKLRKIGDGGGLWLVVSPGKAADADSKRPGPASWVFRYRFQGSVREMGLGSYPDKTLKDARKEAARQRGLLDNGIDPIAHRAAAEAAASVPAAEVQTFKQCALAHIEAQRPGWRNAKHADQWSSTLDQYVYPEFGDTAVGAVTTAQVVKVLAPIWLAKNTTARRVRERIESVLNAAKALGLREGENVAVWRGHLQNLMPRYTGKVTHHAALPYPEMPAFMERLRAQHGISALALEFLILCASRTGEAIYAKWSEFDLGAGLWVIPPERVKTNKTHRVPLSPRALAIVSALHENRVGSFVFSGTKLKKPLSNMALLGLLRRMGRDDLTAHGFRSTFRDWCAEATDFPSEVAEMALSHAVEDKVEGAYRRGDLFEKRKLLMAEWANYCSTPHDGKVITLRPAKAS